MDAVKRVQVAADVLSEFLEVAIHCILHCRGVYPQGVFGRRKKYNVPVQVCLHPDVDQYITNVATSIRAMLLDGAVERVVVVITAPDSLPLERFVFDIDQTNQTSNRPGREDSYLLHLEQSLRALLLKLNVSDALLKPLPSGCSWTVHVHTKESAATKLEERLADKDFTWVEAEEDQQHVTDPQLIPMKSLSSNLFKVQLYAEESGKKT
ncbi:hypothetical protein BaRGS_00013127 [Batillaria attramentaria]|uniref:Mitotic spindle assembly checkpoint protein MAD2B n=1 Tax=Batillaria attramentaria TaxID=370345 RepID=A0ABD0L8J4_9CAEN